MGRPNVYKQPAIQKSVSIENPVSQVNIPEIHNKRLLVVEDDPVNRTVMDAILNSIGIQYEFAEDGQEAVEAYEKQAFDLIFMDCQMPEMNGYEASKTIRSIEKSKSKNHTAIIALTAHAQPDEKNKCLSSGMDDCLTKPVRIQQIKKVIEQWIHV